MFRKFIVLAGMMIATFTVALDTKPAEAGRYWRGGGGVRFHYGYGGYRSGWGPRAYYRQNYYRPYYGGYYGGGYYGGGYYGRRGGVYYYY